MAQRATDRIDAASTVSLAIPADPAYVGTVRYFVATMARHAALSEELTSDVRLAVSEACAEAIDAGATGSIRVTLSLEPEAMAVEVASGPAQLEKRAAPELEGSELVPIYRLQLIRALFPDATSDEVHGMRIVRFTVRPAGSSRA